MNKIGGLSPKKQIPKDINDEDINPDDDDPSPGKVAAKVPLFEDEKKDPDLISDKKKH